MCSHMPTPTPACLILYGRGGVAGEVVGVEAEVAGLAGAGLHPTATPSGKTMNEILLEEVKYA